MLAIAALLAGRYLGWWWLDPAVGILGSIVIARWAWGLMKDTAAILLDTAEPALTAKVRALAEAEGEWTPEKLAAFLEKPRDYAKGTKMSFAGLRKEDERADVIAYLATFQ